MRLLWLPNVLKSAGLSVNQYPGWQTRGDASFGPVRGIVCHGTAGSRYSTDAGELRTIAITGSNSATAPIAQLYLSRTGTWWVCASGTCTGVRTGWGGALAGYGDDAILQIEAQHHPDEPWTKTQYDSYARGVAALVGYTESGYDISVSRVVGHGEHQPGSKSDPWFDMDMFRQKVTTLLGGGMVTNDEIYDLLDDGKRAQVSDSAQTSSEPRYGSMSNSRILREIQKAGFDARYAADGTDAVKLKLDTLSLPNVDIVGLANALVSNETFMDALAEGVAARVLDGIRAMKFGAVDS